MYRKTNRQVALLSPLDALPPAQRARIRNTWAEGFREKIYPLLLQAEADFANLYDKGNGRPNWSVARMLGITLLQGMLDMGDQEALDALSFDFRWQYALDLWGDEAYLSRRSLVDFRARMISACPDGSMMRKLFGAIVAAGLLDLKISVKEQRLDSTRILSNIRTHGRADLFAKTLDHFVKELAKHKSAKLALLPAAIRNWASGVEGSGFGWQSAEEAKAKTPQLALWLVRVRGLFAEDKDVLALGAYKLVVRVIDEHIDVLPAEGEAAQGPGTNGGGSAPSGDEQEKPVEAASPPPDEAPEAEVDAELTPTNEPPNQVAGCDDSGPGSPPTDEPRIALHPLVSAGTALQSPYDPDAGYGHKGPGYHVQVVETCNNNGVELITDYEVHGAGVSDQGKAEEAIVRLTARKLRPDILSVDTNYVSSALLLKAQETGLEILGPVSRGALPVDAIGRDQWTRDPETGLLSHCPMGHPVMRHGQRVNGDHKKVLHAFVDATHCRADCPLKSKCMARSGGEKHKSFHIEDTPEMRLRDERLALQKTPAWRARYRIRGGVESTNSELKRKHGLRCLRVRRSAQVHIAVAAKLIGCNIKRWLKAAAK